MKATMMCGGEALQQGNHKSGRCLRASADWSLGSLGSVVEPWWRLVGALVADQPPRLAPLMHPLPHPIIFSFLSLPYSVPGGFWTPARIRLKVGSPRVGGLKVAGPFDPNFECRVEVCIEDAIKTAGKIGWGEKL